MRFLRSAVTVGGCRSVQSLIWLESVKQAVGLRSENVPASFRLGFTAASLSQRQEHFCFLRLFNAEIRESTRGVASTKLSTGHGPTRRCFFV
jgi:hypothetical protein